MFKSCFCSLMLLGTTVFAAENLLPESVSKFEGAMPGLDVMRVMWNAEDAKLVPGAGVNGSQALELNLTGKTKRVLLLPENRPFKSGETVTASAKIRSDKAGGPVLLLIWGTTKLWEPTLIQKPVNHQVSTEWTDFTVSAKLEKDINVLGVMVAAATAQGIDKVYIDDVSLTSDRQPESATVAAASANLIDADASGFEKALPEHPILTAMWDRQDVKITSDVSFCGQHSLEFTLSPKTKRIIVFPRNVEFKEGDVVTGSAYLRGDETGGPILLYLWGTNKLWETAVIQAYTHGPVTKEWKQFKITAKMPKDVKFLGVMVAGATAKGVSKIYIDEIKMERGSNATPSVPDRKEPNAAIDRTKVKVIPLAAAGKTPAELRICDFFVRGVQP